MWPGSKERYLLPAMFSGSVFACELALIALSFNLSYRVLGFANFSHVEYVTIAGLVAVSAAGVMPIYLAAVCVLPEILISYAGVPFYFGGTSLLIVVSVTMDTVAQIQSHLLAHQYEGLIKRARLRGARRR